MPTAEIIIAIVDLSLEGEAKSSWAHQASGRRDAMVEGPGCTRNGRKVQQAVGCRVVVDDTAGSPKHLIDGLRSHQLLEAFSVGKELFLIFGTVDTDDDAVVRISPKCNRSRSSRCFLRHCSGMSATSLWDERLVTGEEIESEQ